MMKYLLILILLPCFLHAQVRRFVPVRVEYDSIMKAYVWYRFDFTTSQMQTRVSLWAISDTKAIIMQDSVYYPKLIGKNNGSMSDSLFMFGGGLVKPMAINKFFLPYSQVTGKPTTWPYSAITGAPVTWPFTVVTGVASLAQLPSIPYSKITDAPITWPYASITGAPTTWPYTSITGTRLPTAVTRGFNASFTPSATRDVQVYYTFSISATMSITGGQVGSVFLEISPNGTTWTTVGTFSNGNTGTLNIGLSIINSQTGQLSFLVPAAYQVRLRTTSTGAPTITYNGGFEIPI